MPGREVFVDYARTKPWTVYDREQDSITEVSGLDEFHQVFPPDQYGMKIEGAPPIDRDKIASVGYGILYTNTNIQQTLRKEMGLRKKDAVDAEILRHVPPERWYEHFPTEPIIQEGVSIWNTWRYHQKQSKSFKNWRKSPAYRDEAFVASEELRHSTNLKEAERGLVRFCKESGIHSYHGDIYGVSCKTMVGTALKRP